MGSAISNPFTVIQGPVDVALVEAGLDRLEQLRLYVLERKRKTEWEHVARDLDTIETDIRKALGLATP